jgi:hypothetical protein
MKKIAVTLAFLALGICLAQAPTGAAQSAQDSLTKPASVSIVPHPGDGVGAYATGNY